MENIHVYYKDKDLKDPKIEQQYVQSYNFIQQIYEHIKDISLLINFNVLQGFASVLEKKYSLEKVYQLAEIMNYAGQNKINEIDLKKDYD